MLNTTNRTSRFSFEDNCNSSKNPSSEIHNYLKNINFIFCKYYAFPFSRHLGFNLISHQFHMIPNKQDDNLKID